MYNSRPLVRDRDYKVSYSNHRDAGTASVTVKGIENYTGTKTLYFTIVIWYNYLCLCLNFFISGNT